MRKLALFLSTSMIGCGSAGAPANAPSAAKPTPAEAHAQAPAAPEPKPLPKEKIVAAHVEATGSLLPVMPTAVTSFGGASDGKYAYVVGGYFGTPHQYSREGQSKTVSRLPLDGKSDWETLGELPVGLQGLSAIAHLGKVCRFGGNQVENAAGEPAKMRSVNEAACFDVEKRVWSALPELPAGRSSHENALIGSTVYVAGGWTLDGAARSGTFASDVLALDLSSKAPQWKSIAAPFQRRAVGVAAAGKKLVVVGGIGPEGSPSRAVDVYDAVEGTWSKGPDFPADAFGVAATGVDGTVYASARDGVVRSYRPGDAAWRDVRRLAFPRFFHQLLPAGGELVAVGGISGMHTDGRTRPVERVGTKDQRASVATLTLDYPGHAKNRYAVFVHDDFVYLFGGNNSLEQHDFAITNFESEGYRLHLGSLTFEAVQPFPARRQTIQTQTDGKQGIALGGFGHEDGAGKVVGKEAVSHRDGFAYDFERDRWTARAGLPRGRTQFGLAAYGGKLWVFGGLNYDPTRKTNAFDHVTDVLAASVSQDGSSFESLPVKMPAERRAFAGAVLGKRYYLVGGMRNEFSLVEDCQTFDFEKQVFEPLPCPSKARLSGDLVVLGERLYLVGGSVQGDGGLEASRRIEVFDPNTNRWSDLGVELPFETRHMRALAYEGHLLLVSTHMKEPRMRVTLVDPGTVTDASGRVAQNRGTKQ